uniref:Acylphosphatase-2 n=1 Tax=Marmota marmota marmota TaxID=9994 RepID=A0A8C6A830_MARMA
MSTSEPLKSVDYEVFGRVQGSLMYTEDEAKKIGVVGWVKNTSKGTVTGQVQGPEDKEASSDHVGKLTSPSLFSTDCSAFSHRTGNFRLQFACGLQTDC